VAQDARLQPGEDARGGPGDFFEWVKYRSHTSRGVTIGTMLQDEALRFIRLGTFLERADNTARILEVKYLNLLPGSDEECRAPITINGARCCVRSRHSRCIAGSTATRSTRFVSPSC
jgi:uncharacterized alpha-E superfamily protein